MEETGIDVEVEHLTGVYKNMTRGIVALVYRCRPTGGAPATSDESRAVRWLQADDITANMAPAYAIRVLDALHGPTASRAHDGYVLIR